MFEFKVLKQSKRSGARLGILKTSHGEVETPAFVPVATQATVKTLTSEEAEEIGSQILMCNTFHLHTKTGEALVARHGGLHSFMNWKKPIMTDSGGFQVFSLGFGKDLGVGKVLHKRRDVDVESGCQPNNLKITEEGVYFISSFDGAKLFLGPEESMRIQEKLGADICFAFDECPPPTADYEYLEQSVPRTHRWAERCLREKKSTQALYGIVQGGKYKDLRIESARFIGSLPFQGFGIGGEFGYTKSAMEKMVRWVTNELPKEKPRHLLGIGHLEDIRRIIKSGVDTFDCIVPTHYARHGVGFTSHGRLDLKKSLFLKEKGPLDKNCECKVCGEYTRGYIAHLVRAKEITGLKLLTYHNLFYFNRFVEIFRKKIRRGEL